VRLIIEPEELLKKLKEIKRIAEKQNTGEAEKLIQIIDNKIGRLIKNSFK